MKNLKEEIGLILNVEDMSNFLMSLSENLKQKPEEWQNISLYDYLESISAWLKDSSERAEAIFPKETNWQFVAMIMLAGKYYE